jgi:hypothetical protein
MRYGLFFGSVARGFIRLLPGLTWGFVGMVAAVIWWAWKVYGDAGTKRPARNTGQKKRQRLNGCYTLEFGIVATFPLQRVEWNVKLI